MVIAESQSISVTCQSRIDPVVVAELLDMSVQHPTPRTIGDPQLESPGAGAGLERSRTLGRKRPCEGPRHDRDGRA